jgi:hypothetical protein
MRGVKSVGWFAGAAVAAICALTWSTATSPALESAALATAPAYTAAGRLVRPLDYREWTFVTSGLGMTYGPAQHASTHPMFDNVFVNAHAYRTFLDTGTWPEQTMFVLEIRRAEEKVSIDSGGRTQGAVVAVEASVKDSSRFPGNGWAYFTFDGPNGLVDDAAPLPATAACYSCHERHALLDNTFVQFYPTLLETARRLGKLDPAKPEGTKP